ncbi:hypothetical protein GCM10022378_08020 [Salinicoccus jeotgali]|uniref:Uncharacterized protein n=1 Tax=Salinicoccus jeotgali TaxID=381634 RepID=A0ABP7END9_9STAP
MTIVEMGIKKHLPYLEALKSNGGVVLTIQQRPKPPHIPYAGIIQIRSKGQEASFSAIVMAPPCITIIFLTQYNMMRTGVKAGRGVWSNLERKWSIENGG